VRYSAKFVPSLFTILNLFCGFLSILNAANNDINQACLFIIYASLFDAFDGVVARFTHTSSRFGVELDSLSDVVSFGAAPSFILYKFYFYGLNGIGIAVASLLMIFSALRLARFNAQLAGFDKSYFIGVPVPVSAITVSSFFLFFFNKNFSVSLSSTFVYIIAIALPLLMVSRFKYDTLPKFTLREMKLHPVKFIFIFLIILFIIFTKGDGLFVFCLFYLCTGLLRSGKNLFKKIFLRKHHESPDPGEKLGYKTGG
jgi:CDP-diacylglycerol--serine O-phosphatidyltransferase